MFEDTTMATAPAVGVLDQVGGSLTTSTLAGWVRRLAGIDRAVGDGSSRSGC